jgi:hypothetical protein
MYHSGLIEICPTFQAHAEKSRFGIHVAWVCKSLGVGAERGARSSQEFQNAKNDGKRYERKGE